MLIDGLDGHIPLQYRYLSLFKIIELNFKIGKKWKSEQLKDTLKPFEAIFNQEGFAKTLYNLIHELRDKCAHIKTGKDIFGVTHLNQKEVAQVEKALPIMVNICISVLNVKSEGKIKIETFP